MAHKARGNGEGSVYEDKARGRWVAQVWVEEDGQRVKRRATAATKSLAKQKLDELRRATADNLPVADGSRTLGELLEEWTIKALPNRNLEAATLNGHSAAVKVLTETLGTKRVKSLTADQVEAVLKARADMGLSRAHCVKLRSTLRMALDWGVRRRYLPVNVATVVELPSHAAPEKEGKSMTPEEVRAFLEAAERTPLEAMWVVSAHLGLRPGEAAGLSWDAVDFDQGLIYIRAALKKSTSGASLIGDTKNRHSVRLLCGAPPVFAALRAHRARQVEQQLAAGPLFQNPGGLVFTSPTGRPTDPKATRAEFKRVAARAGLKGWTPHGLRHTAASLLSDAGVPLERIADQLGHRDTRMLSRTYRHKVRQVVGEGAILGSILKQAQ